QILLVEDVFWKKKKKKAIITMGLVDSIDGLHDAQGSTEDLGSDTDELNEKELGNEGNQSFQKLAEIFTAFYVGKERKYCAMWLAFFQNCHLHFCCEGIYWAQEVRNAHVHLIDRMV
ncbi:hypothetical protein ACJX0J_022960, partial [Zea mays]